MKKMSNPNNTIIIGKATVRNLVLFSAKSFFLSRFSFFDSFTLPFSWRMLSAKKNNKHFSHNKNTQVTLLEKTIIKSRGRHSPLSPWGSREWEKQKRKTFTSTWPPISSKNYTLFLMGKQKFQERGIQWNLEKKKAEVYRNMEDLTICCNHNSFLFKY